MKPLEAQPVVIERKKSRADNTYPRAVSFSRRRKKPLQIRGVIKIMKIKYGGGGDSSDADSTVRIKTWIIGESSEVFNSVRRRKRKTVAAI
ncbi:hypothetical protein C5167_006145 [Papaver somniferum]|uniref:Uncharacterized protein n=1 Tax=Papaver somniferum TaxID=3469 RepID=A0A4Y7JFY5_PAPSO|nr:hypothetical protein C5167_006145 [Papaver somniferum]